MSRHNSHRRILLAVWVFTAAISGSVKADMIFTQAGVEGLSDDGTGNPAGYQTYPTPGQYWVQGASVSLASGTAPGSTARATVSLLTNSGIHLYSSGVTSGFPSNTEPFCQSIAGGQWQDVIRLTGTASHPSDILIGVHVEGNISLMPSQQSIVWQETARIGIANSPATGWLLNAPSDAAGFNNLNVSEVWVGIGSSQYPSFFLSSNTKGLTQDASSGSISVAWGATFDLAYDPSVGGYHFNLYASDHTVAESFGNVTGDFLSTFQLTSVTLPNGDPLPGPITFDSGFTLQSVSEPEPSSLISAGTGVLMTLAYAWGRRVARRGSRGLTA
jgi:hypothetical protein